MKPLGARLWAIAEGYIPPASTGGTRELTSHETVCLLNAGDADAQVTITVFFTDREPAGPYRIAVPARRTRHVRFNDLSEPEAVPAGTDFASVIESDVPIVVQHTRLDSRQPALALLSTVAFPATGRALALKRRCTPAMEPPPGIERARKSRIDARVGEPGSAFSVDCRNFRRSPRFQIRLARRRRGRFPRRPPIQLWRIQ